MPFIMCFQGPPGAEPLNHTPLPHVNSLSSKLIDGKEQTVSTKSQTQRKTDWAQVPSNWATVRNEEP
jgi:hypothetical protein